MDWKAIPDEQITSFQRTQQAVKVWLERVLEVRLEDSELWGPLRNGVVLCYLMRALDPDSIPRINVDSRDFKYKENVEFFTAALKDLGVPFFKIFSVNDLFDGDGESRGNIVNVVTCLAEMTTLVCEHFDGVPTLDDCRDAKWSPPALSASRMAGLKKMQARVKTAPPRGTKVKVSALVVQKKLQLMAGNGVSIDKFVPGFTRFQALVRGALARRRYKAMVRDQAYRDHVAKEILSTERVYVEALRSVVEVFLKPMKLGVLPPGAKKRKKPLLTEDEILCVFSEVEQILRLNEELLKSLEARVARWSPGQCLGDIFLQLAEYLKMYTPYVQNFNAAMAKLESLEKRKDVARFLTECKAEPRTNRLDLPSFLIMPIQRIPRYNLLLADITKHTWSDHPDLKNLRQAVEKISEIAKVINDKKREAENMSRMLQISRTITGKGVDKLNLAEPHRRLILEGDFNLETKTPFSCYLLSDMLLLCTPIKRGEVALKDAHKITVVDVTPVDDTTFDLIKYGTSKPIARLTAPSAVLCEKWMEQIRRVRNEEKEARNIKDQFAQKKRAFYSPAATHTDPRAVSLSAEMQLRARQEEKDKNVTNRAPVTPLDLARDARIRKEGEVAALEAKLCDKKSKWKKGEKESALEKQKTMQAELDECIAKEADLEAEEMRKVKRRSGRPVSVAYGSAPVRASPERARTGSTVGDKGKEKEELPRTKKK